MPSTNKIKLLISDILLYDKKLESGYIDLEKKTLEYDSLKNKITNKQKKIKNKDKKQKEKKGEEETTTETNKETNTENVTNELDSLNEKIEKLNSEKLKLLVGKETYDSKTINERLNYYKEKIDGYVKE